MSDVAVAEAPKTEPPKVAPQAPPVPTKVQAISESRYKLAEHRNNRQSVIPEHGTPFENLLRPEFWAHVARKFTPGDIIEAHAEDGSYFAEMYVIDCGPNWARTGVHKLSRFDEAVTEPGADNAFKVEWAGRFSKWRVVRSSDLNVMKDGLPSKDAANLWLSDHRKATGI